MTDTSTTPETPAHTSRVEARGDAVWITLERGEKNLLDADMTAWLRDTVREANAQQPTAIVIAGAGATFCCGADGPYLRSSGSAGQFADACVDLFEQLHTQGTPVIAVLDGDALAGGFGLACLADILLATPGTRLGTIEASVGGWPFIAQAPVLARLPVKVGLTNLLTGVPFDAERGLELALVDEVLPAADLDDAVPRYLDLLRPSAAAARTGRPLMRAALDPDFSQVLRAGAGAFVRAFS